MNNSRLIDILQKQIISEKTMNLREQNCLTFRVIRNATKYEIKTAVETLLNTEVVDVRTMNMAGKKRRSAHGIGCRSDWKKAYVTVAGIASEDIEVQPEIKESN